MVEVLDAEAHAFAALLAKSADYGTREMGWTALATPEVEKVGPKGYIHGWVFVGAPGVGTLVEHARHGRGKVTHVDEHGHVHVDFGGGKKHSFEHAGGEGTGMLAPRAKGTDRFSTHLDAATAANRRGDHAAAAGHYRQAADTATHPRLASEMHQRADVAAAKIPGLRPSTASEFARTDISSAVRSHDREHQDFPDTAARLDALSDGLRDGTIKVPDAANRLDQIVASHVAAHGTDNHTFARLDMHARDMRSDPRIGQLMKPPPKPRAPRKPKAEPAKVEAPVPAHLAERVDRHRAGHQKQLDETESRLAGHRARLADAQTHLAAIEDRRRREGGGLDHEHRTAQTMVGQHQMAVDLDETRRDELKEAIHNSVRTVTAAHEAEQEKARADQERMAASAAAAAARHAKAVREIVAFHGDDGVDVTTLRGALEIRGVPRAQVGPVIDDALRDGSLERRGNRIHMGRPRAEADAKRAELANAKLVRDHTRQALGARMRGQHAEANRHLEAAAALETDPGKRADLLDARRGTPEHPGPTAADDRARVRRRIAEGARAEKPGGEARPTAGSAGPAPEHPDVLEARRQAASRPKADASQVAGPADRLMSDTELITSSLPGSEKVKPVDYRDLRPGDIYAHGNARRPGEPEGHLRTVTSVEHFPNGASFIRHDGGYTLHPSNEVVPAFQFTGSHAERERYNAAFDAREAAGARETARLSAEREAAQAMGRSASLPDRVRRANEERARAGMALIPGSAGQADHVQQVHDAYRQTATRPGDWVPLADIRDRLPHLSRDQQDQALRHMARTDRDVRLIPWDNRKALTGRERAASLRHGGADLHAIGVTPPGTPGRATGGPPGAPATPARPVARAGREVPSSADVGAALRRATSREQAHTYLDGLKLSKDQYKQLAKDLDVPAGSGASKAELRRVLVEVLVGGRVDGDAIMRHSSAPRT